MTLPQFTKITALSDGAVDSELSNLLTEAGTVERRILLAMARRLVAVGQRSYGPLDLRTERRDMLREAFDEDADGLVYRAVDLLQRGAI